MGQDGVLLSSEVYLYVFDATLMFLMMVLLNIWHPDFTKEDLRTDHSDGGESGAEYAMLELPKP